MCVQLDHVDDVKRYIQSFRTIRGLAEAQRGSTPLRSSAEDERDDEHDPVVGVSDDHLPTV